jgi:general stress protein 26
MNAELDKFYGLIDEIKIAMMTTRRPDGHLESRAMANQKRAGGADLWFVTAEGTGKLRDIEHDPRVNLAYCNAWAACRRTRCSLSGFCLTCIAKQLWCGFSQAASLGRRMCGCGLL